jgi:hypothetical protein
MSEKFNIPIAKHLEDVDDLFQNRDAGLVPNQEHLADTMADSIYEHALTHNFKILLFCISPKKRALETAELIRGKLATKEIKLPIITEVDTNLREIDQGKFILPEGYIAGEPFLGLKIAGKIFSAETFNSKDSSLDNLNYHFGDPLLQNDGTYKYPELEEYFDEPGESYKEVLLRFYSLVIKLSKNLERFNDKVEPVIFTHGQPHQIFTNLAEVAEMVDKNGLIFEPGSLPRICWDLYTSKRKGVTPFGEMNFVSVEQLCKPEIVELLKKEVAALESV